MQKYKILIQYLGTRYQGWQIQGREPTIQLALTDAVEKVTRERVSVVGSGRTDSGVHALGQVAHFRLDGRQDTGRLKRALNGVLPEDIRILRLTPVAASFHAQKDAQKKRYLYRIYDGDVLGPFFWGRVFHSHHQLDSQRMAQAAGLILGRHDFTGFAASRSSARDKRRTVLRSQVRRRGRHLSYVIEGDGFLHHMVRNIVGTLLEVGRCRRPAEDMPAILKAGDRRLAGPTAAPWGLYLSRVWYSPTPLQE